MSRLKSLSRPSRAVLVHAHLFKNAGSTFDWSLCQSFGYHFLDHRDDDAMRQGADYLGPFLEQHRELLALSSQWITFPLPETQDTRIHLALFIRDPIERVRSVYNFEKRQQPAQTPGARKAKTAGFREYVRWNLQPEQGPAIRNFHTRYLSGNYLGDDLASLYARAVETIETTQTIGLVHRYDESMVLFEHLMLGDFPDLDLSYRLQNATTGTLGSLQQRRDSVLEELGDVADDLLLANQFDLQLYALTQSRFATALSGVPELAARLANLHDRNQGHLE